MNNEIKIESVKTKNIECSLLSLQHPARPALSHHRRHELYQLLDQKQTRHHTINDGLFVREMRALHYGLRDGRVGEARTNVSNRVANSQRPAIRASTVFAQGHVR